MMASAPVRSAPRPRQPPAPPRGRIPIASPNAQMARAVVPFYVPLVFTLLVITYRADFVLAVPRLFGKPG